MKEHIIKAILYEDMSVKWKDADESGGNVRLNAHQKTRQFVELELGDFILSDGEAILAAFEHTTDGETNHINPSLMQKIDGENAYRIQIPSLVHNTPGEWGVQFFVATNYAAGEYDHAYPSNKVYFLEGSSFVDDGLTIPSGEDFNALYAAATDAKVIATGAKDEAVDANIKVQAARLEIVGEDGNGGVLATIKENSEKIEASRAETEELAANAAASAKSAADSEALALQHRMDYTPKIEQNSRDIANLYAINEQNGQFAHLNVAQAYTSRVTASGANIFDDQLTPVLEIAGSTVKCDNLLKFPYDDMGGMTGKNITVSILNDGGIKIKGELTSDEVSGGAVYRRIYLYSVSSAKLNFTAEKITLNIYANTGLKTTKIAAVVGQGDFSYDECSLNKGTTTLTRTGDGTQMRYFFLDIYPGQSFDCVVYLMLTAGETPQLYQPYFTGLKHANINSIISTGKNLFNVSKIQNTEFITNNGDGSITVAANKHLAATGLTLKEICPDLRVGMTCTLSLESDNSKDTLPLIYVPSGSWYSGATKLITKALLDSSVSIYGHLTGSSLYGQPCVTKNIQIELGDTATAYEPYIEPSVFQLPETVELGLFDKILPQEGEILRRGNKVVLTGQEGWSTTGVTVYTSELPAYTYVGRPSFPTNDPAYHGGICNVGRFVPDNNTAGCYMSNNGKTLYFTRELLVSIGLLTKTDNGDGTYTYGEINADVVNGWKAWLKSRYDNGDPVMVEYFVTKEYATTETINASKVYTAWNGGSETIVQGETDNSQFGAMPTVTQTYFGKVGEE